MWKAALLGACLVLGGCSGFGKYISDTATLPRENPNAPSGVDLNMRRIHGYSTAETSILPQGGDIWPGPPAPLPTLEDVEKDRIGTVLGGAGGQSGVPELLDGGEMSVNGSSEQPVSKEPMGKLPDAEPDVANKYGVQSGNASTIEIPNGDGTVTLIHPDGSVTTSQPPRKATAPKQ